MDSSIPPASSSSYQWSFDVFLSFRGEDTRFNFVSHLNMALRQRRINVFIDDKLSRGEGVYASLMKTIEESKISIVIISEDYASSSWCLDELVKIIECKKSNGQVVFPVFYKVDPSDVRKQSGTFGGALAKHEVRSSNKMQAWREALTAVSHLSAWVLKNEQNEATFIQTIVQEVLNKLNDTAPLDVARYPVGNDSEIEFMNLLSRIMSNGITMVGIHGMGGIGKTTLAKALYNKIANQFEGCIFLPNVREASTQFDGLVQLQEMLLSEIFVGDMIKVSNVYKGINIIRNRLHSKRILLVLDDIDESQQLEALAGGRNWFAPGSKIIVTTRDSHLLPVHGFDLQYHLQELSNDKALELFSWHAFKNSHPSSGYSNLSRQAIDYCKGLPLALVVLGSFLCDRKQSEWKSILDAYENSSLDKGIQGILQISYDGLEAQTQEIFLHLSCFLTGKLINDVKMILEACGTLCPDKGITRLVDLSLLTIHQHSGKIEMHDLIQQMGRSIAFSESANPRKKKRLLVKDDVEDVLNDSKETRVVRAIKLIFPQPTKLDIDIDAGGFRNVKNLIFIEFQNVIFSGDLEYLSNRLRWIDWPNFPSSSFPSSYKANNLIQLKLQGSSIKNLGDVFMNCELLRSVNLSKSKFLEEIPDFSTALNLEELNLQKCTNLVKVHESVGSLAKLANLFLNGCCNLTQLPSYLKLKSLKHLDLKDCKKLENFPHIGEEMKSSSCNVILDNTPIRELPPSIEYLIRLGHLSLYSCANLITLPSTIYCLSELTSLQLGNCYSFCTFPLPFFCSSSLSSNLRSLNLINCNISNVSFLETFSHVARSSLLMLNLSGNNFSSLPSCIVDFSSLEKLLIYNCKFLEEIPKIPACIDVVHADGCISLAKFPDNIIDMISYDQGDVHNILRGLFYSRHLLLTNCDIPEWYDYKNANNSITFWMPHHLGRKLKVFAPCVVFKLKYPIKTYDIRMRCVVSINNIQVWNDTKRLGGSFDCTPPSENMCLLVIDASNFYPQYPDEDGDSLEIVKTEQLPSNWIDCMTNDSNKFTVSFKAAKEKDAISYRKCGVHLVYEE